MMIERSDGTKKAGKLARFFRAVGTLDHHFQMNEFIKKC